MMASVTGRRSCTSPAGNGAALPMAAIIGASAASIWGSKVNAIGISKRR
jgi:hypothetical protein